VAIANQSLCSIKTMLGEWQGAVFLIKKSERGGRDGGCCVERDRKGVPCGESQPQMHRKTKIWYT
jgi:hypothetical protein